MTPEQYALLPIVDRVFGQQPVDGHNPGEKYTAFICYGCPADTFYRDAGTYPHFLSMERVKAKTTD